MDINAYNALKMRVQQGLQRFASAMDEMFGHVVAANARADLVKPAAETTAQTVDIPAGAAADAALEVDPAPGTDAGPAADPVAGAFGDNPSDEAPKTDSV